MSQLLQNALYGTAMILVAAVLRRALRDRLVPGARLALWAVCLFRLLTPAAPVSALSLWGLSRLFAPKPQAVPASAPASQLYVLPQAVSTPRPNPGIPWETVLFTAWLAVGAVLAVRYVLSWRRTHRAVACAIPLNRGDPRYALLPKCARLREGPMEGAPLTFGTVRPTVVLSPGLDGEELECVLAHEGVHAARRDNLWHYAMALALAVHWWNPAVWLMSRLLRRDIELSCDRAALKKLGGDRRADYANALVTLATQADGPAFCQTFGRKAAEERILSIMKFKKTSIIGVIFTLSLVLAVTVAFASEPKELDDAPAPSILIGEGTAIYDNEWVGSTRIVSLPDIEATKGIQSDYPEVDPDDADLSVMKELYAQMVAGGELTQEQADAAMADAEDMLEQARRGELKLFVTEDGWVYGMGVGKMYYEDENGDLHPLGPSSVVGGDPGPVPSAAPNAMSAIYLENGYTLDANGNALVYDEAGRLFMTAVYGYLPCILEDCTVSGEHYHANGEVVPFPESNAPAPAFEPNVGTAPMQAPYCPICTDTRLHLHMDGRTIPLADPCPVEGCTITGNHIHGDTVYSCSGAGHDGGFCDGSCYVYFNQPDVISTSAHHSDTHHSSEHH